MENYYPNQRYTSEGEPELGVGILKQLSKGRLEIHFPSCNETRLYSSENAPLRRLIFKPGDSITNQEGETIIVKRVEEQDGLYLYVGENRMVSEANLGDLSVNYGVDEKLLQGDVDKPDKFALRRSTLLHDFHRRTSPIYGFVGPRIDLIPHQLYIADEVSSRYAPRVLLSDQVGLGKTIEACLILHRLLASGRISRAIILVPESLVHQWFVELLRKFNLWFNIFDEERCAALDESSPDGNPFLDNQLILCSTSFLANSQKRAAQALSSKWDMLIVDEAHHLKYSQTEVSREYSIVEMLSKETDGLLLLTATPEQLGIESHFARLRLLDANRYANYDDFLKEHESNKQIANIVKKIYADKKLNQSDIKLLESIVSVDKISALASDDNSAKNKLIEDLLDQYGPGRVLFRNTRQTMSGFPKRIAHLVPLDIISTSRESLNQLKKEFESDANIKEASEFKPKFSNDSRVDWIKQRLQDKKSEKHLLICTSKEKVLALDKQLSKLGNIKTAIFHEDLSIVQRDRNAAYFAESDGAQILICSEIGSEGRNFQFAHHLILFDLPLHPEVLEQRIGRLDRIGQNADIHIHIPFITNSPQHALTKWYHNGLNAFEINMEGGNFIFKHFGEDVLSVCLSNENQKLEELIQNTSDFQKEMKANLAKGRDTLLEMNSFRPARAEKLINLINAEDKDTKLENYLTRVFNHFHIDMEDLAPHTYSLYPSISNTGNFPTITHRGMPITFDRKRALSREDVRFVSWEHPIVNDAIDMVLSTGLGSASFGVLQDGEEQGLIMEMLFVLETAGKQNIDINRFLPNSLIRVVVDHSGNDVSEDYPSDILDKKLRPGQIDSLLENQAFANVLIPNMIATGEAIAQVQSSEIIEKGINNMNSNLNHEIERHALLHSKNKDLIRKDEIKTAIEEQKRFTHIIENAKIRLDSVLLILRG